MGMSFDESRESERSWYIVGSLGQNWKAISTKLDDQYDSGLFSSLKTVQFCPFLTYSFSSQAIHFLIQGPSTLVDRPDRPVSYMTVHFQSLRPSNFMDRPLWLRPFTLDLNRSTIPKTGHFEIETDKKLSASRICIFNS